MGLIKQSHVPAGVAAFSLRDVEKHAKAILVRAREQAEALLASAQQEGEVLRQQAYEEGLVEGRRDGRKQGELEGTKAGAQQALAEHQEQLATLVATLSTAALEFDASRLELEAAGLSEVVALSAAVARRVTKRQGMIDPDVLAENLQEAMKFVCHAADVRVAIHPKQKQVLEDALPRLRMAWPELKHLEIIPDASIAPGGCRIFTARGQVDGDLDAQLDRVIGELLPDGSSADAGPTES
jgi:flagellar biosynthesis/type III secretory pathway protein FliH